FRARSEKLYGVRPEYSHVQLRNSQAKHVVFYVSRKCDFLIQRNWLQWFSCDPSFMLLAPRLCASVRKRTQSPGREHFNCFICVGNTLSGKGFSMTRSWPATCMMPSQLQVMNIAAQPARILIGEDQQDVQDALHLLLKGAGYVADGATTPDSILTKLDANAYDLVLMDLNYRRDTTSGSEGLEILGMLRKLASP